MKRIGIFSFYDKDGIIDDYVLFYLKSMKTVLHKIIFVSNGRLASGEEKKLGQLAAKIIIRGNEGFDAGAYKEVISKERHGILSDADELLLFNDTVFGPFYPIEDIFEEMDKKEADFWGITRHEKAIAWGIPVPACVQSYFIGIRKRMLCSDAFMEFWDSQPDVMETLKDAVLKFEFAFTSFFEKRDFRWMTYIDFHELDSVDVKYNFSPTYYANYELVKYKKYPFIKRKNFVFHDGYKLCNGEDIRKCMEYVNENGLYDMGMIWKNILRIYDIQDIYAACHFAFINPSGIRPGRLLPEADAVLVAEMKNDLTASYFLEKIRNAADEFQKIVIFAAPGVIEKVKETEGLDGDKFEIYTGWEWIPPLKAETEEAELLCYISDYGYDCKTKYASKSNTYSVIDNLIESAEMVRGVKEDFRTDSYLGVLFAPEPYIGKECLYMGGVWPEKRYNYARELYGVLGLTVPLTEKKWQISGSSSFWCRMDIIKEFWKHGKGIIHRLKREETGIAVAGILPYLAQQHTYYSGISLSNKQAGIAYVNYREILRSLMESYREERIAMDFPLEYMGGAKQINDFCERYEKIYIYGAGDYGRKVWNALERNREKVLGFVVSSRESGLEEFCGYPVIERKEMSIGEEIGVILAMSAEKQQPVWMALKEMNIHNLFRV